MRNKGIGIVGSGIVGLAVGRVFHLYDNDVIFYDLKQEVLFRLEGLNYQTAKNLNILVDNSDVIFVAVPTPTIDGKIDLSYVESACNSIARELRTIKQRNNIYPKEKKIVAIKSTIVPGTMESLIKPIFEGLDVGLCYNPEFLRQLTSINDFLHQDKIILGYEETYVGKRMMELYSVFKTPTIETDFKTAEAIKYIANCFLATKISYFNEVYEFCKKLKLDIPSIEKAMFHDRQVSPYGTRNVGPFGGACLIKDSDAFFNLMEEKGFVSHMLKSAITVNHLIQKGENKMFWKNTRGLE